MLLYEKAYKSYKLKIDIYINTVIFDPNLPWYKVWFCRFIPWMIITPIIGSRYKYIFYYLYLFISNFTLYVRYVIFF
jgi:hypothetical protein